MCSKHTVTNGCGHEGVADYVFCGGDHADTTAANEICFNSSPDTSKNRPVNICMGTRFCNRGCKALAIGWSCCTCGFKSVDGFYHPVINMAVHWCLIGNMHAFCVTCRDAKVAGPDDNWRARTRALCRTRHSTRPMARRPPSRPEPPSLSSTPPTPSRQRCT